MGVRIARFHDVVLLGKLIWDLCHNPNKLWVQLVSAKYPWVQFEDLFLYKSLYTMTSLTYVFEVIKDGFQLKIGRGDSSFWYDSWMRDSSLASKVDFVNVNIRDVYTTDGWDFSNLYIEISPSIRDSITVMWLILHHASQVLIVWSKDI
ncbi:hypothetical protein HKD37_15G042496 [Glycine soja]